MSFAEQRRAEGEVNLRETYNYLMKELLEETTTVPMTVNAEQKDDPIEIDWEIPSVIAEFAEAIDEDNDRDATKEDILRSYFIEEKGTTQFFDQFVNDIGEIRLPTGDEWVKARHLIRTAPDRYQRVATDLVPKKKETHEALQKASDEVPDCVQQLDNPDTLKKTVADVGLTFIARREAWVEAAKEEVRNTQAEPPENGRYR